MYAAGPDPYCYPGTRVLRNRLDLRDEKLLEAFELDAVAQRSDEPLPDGDLSANHFCRVHHHLFQDVYEWAGQYRTVRMSKGKSAFCYPENIASEMDRLFDWLAKHSWLEGLDRAAYAQRCAHFLSELNAIHPFREGNGRTQMVFVGLLTLQAGHTLNLSRIDPMALVGAMVAAFHGDEVPLEEQLLQLL